MGAKGCVNVPEESQFALPLSIDFALEENLIDVISSFLIQIQQSTVKNVEFPLSFARKG